MEKEENKSAWPLLSQPTTEQDISRRADAA